MTNRLEDEIQRIIASLDEEHTSQEQDLPGTTEQETEPETNTEISPDEIQNVYVLIVREREEEGEPTQVVESTLVLPQKTSFLPAYAVCCFYVLLIVSTLVFQLSCLFNPPIATVTIMPKTQTVTLTGTLQLGRLLQPVTISQSQTVPTTGKGHQSAKAATGFLTFYNGQFTGQTIAAGTILTGTDGIQIITDQDATIPAANPPIFGQVTVPAHAINQGVRGNIPAYDINQACCTASVLAKNPQPFTGGQDERDFQIVAKQDIASVVTPLKTAVTQSVDGAFQGQLKPDEQVFILPCIPTTISDHQPGQEANTVKVTVSQTCSAVVYNEAALQAQAADLLAQQAGKQLGTSYSLFGNMQVSVTTATVPNTTKPLVFLLFHAQGTWVYGLSQKAQEQIKQRIAGKTKQAALRLLAALPGVEQAAIRFGGFGDDTRLPKDTEYIPLILIWDTAG